MPAKIKWTIGFQPSGPWSLGPSSSLDKKDRTFDSTTESSNDWVEILLQPSFCCTQEGRVSFSCFGPLEEVREEEIKKTLHPKHRAVCHYL